MTDYLTIFGVGFVTVFIAGFQSRAVNHGNYVLAAGNSMLLGVGNAFVWTQITDPDTSLLGWITYGLSGAFGITASMWVHERFFKKRHKP